MAVLNASPPHDSANVPSAPRANSIKTSPTQIAPAFCSLMSLSLWPQALSAPPQPLAREPLVIAAAGGWFQGNVMLYYNTIGCFGREFHDPPPSWRRTASVAGDFAVAIAAIGPAADRGFRRADRVDLGRLFVGDALSPPCRKSASAISPSATNAIRPCIISTARSIP